MPEQPHSEHRTWDYIVVLFTGEVHPGYRGYQHLGDWSKRKTFHLIAGQPG
jgi:hypothetical protein